MIFFGSIIYIVEHGTFKVTAAYPDGEFMRLSINQGVASQRVPNVTMEFLALAPDFNGFHIVCLVKWRENLHFRL